MAWCHQATSHYLSQCWPRSISPYGITRPQWVNKCLFIFLQKWDLLCSPWVVRCHHCHNLQYCWEGKLLWLLTFFNVIIYFQTPAYSIHSWVTSGWNQVPSNSGILFAMLVVENQQVSTMRGWNKMGTIFHIGSYNGLAPVSLDH